MLRRAGKASIRRRPVTSTFGITTTMLTLRGSLVTLRPLHLGDRSAILAATADGELWANPLTVVPDETTVDSYLQRALTGAVSGQVIPFAVTLTADGSLIGSTRFWKIDRDNRSLEIGHTWYAQSWQRTGVNTEAKLLMLRYAFEELMCVRVQFTTDVLNERSRSAILRLGATEEGVIRHERIMPNGRKRNSVRFSIIDDEWPTVRARLISLQSRNSAA